MAEARVDDDDFKLVTEGFVAGTTVTVVTLPCHLSPETSTESMTIRWFKGTECIYLYKKGQVTEGRGYDDRLTLNTQELQKGNVSLTLSDYRETDDGVYICQVQHGEQEEETAVTLKSQALITTDDEIRIKTLGLTRAGITATGNAILGYRAFKATSTRCKKVTGVVDGRKVSVIDFPAWFDAFYTGVHEDETGKKLLVEEGVRCKRLADPGPHVFLHVIQMKKITPEENILVVLYTGLVLGLKKKLKKNMILFTHGGDLDLQYCSVEDCWKAFPKLKEVISKYCSEGRCHVFNTEDPSQVTELLKKIHELVMKNGGYNDTDEADTEDEDDTEDEGDAADELEKLLMEKWQMLKKRIDEEARSQDRPILMEENTRTESARLLEMLPVKRQHVGEELQKLSVKVDQLTVQLEERERREMKLEETIQKLQAEICSIKASQANTMQEIEVVKRELQKTNNKLEKSKKNKRNLSNKVNQLTDQLKDKESEHEKTKQKLKGLSTLQGLFKLKAQEVKESQRSNSTTFDKLLSMRTDFIESVSGPNLDSTLDDLLTMKVINDQEMDSIIRLKPRAVKARAIIDLVRMKGDKACSIMIEIINKRQNLI